MLTLRSAPHRVRTIRSLWESAISLTLRWEPQEYDRCSYFDTGKCRYEDDCPFLHDYRGKGSFGWSSKELRQKRRNAVSKVWHQDRFWVQMLQKVKVATAL